MARRVLVAVAAFVTICSTDSAPVGVGSFVDLNLAVASGVPTIEITAPEIVFKAQLYVRHAEMLIESTIGATLSGGYQTRLFFLEKNAKLSLRGLRLENGMARGCAGDLPECISHGGAFFVSAGSELRLQSAQLFNNQAHLGGGAIYATNSSVTATDCTMASNSAHWGGAVHLTGGSDVAVTNCTIGSNSASGGGAIYTHGDSIVTATDCTMASNSAHWGGAVYTHSDSTAIATDCTMTSNSASSWGGAVAADGNSTVTAASCTMTSNTADWGGAVYTVGDSTVTATDSMMSSNSASRGGAVAVGGNSVVVSRTAASCTATVANCVMTSNSASLSGGSVFVRKGGTADLIQSVFQHNLGGATDTDDGVGIVNLNGQVRCDAAIGCLTIRGRSTTVCHDEDGPSLSPTPQPMVQNYKREMGGSFIDVSLFVGFLLCLFGSLVGLCCHFKFDRNQPRDENSEGVEVHLLRVPLMENPEQSSDTAVVGIDGNATEQHGSTNTSMAPSPNEDNEQPEIPASLPLSAFGSSPSPIFVIDREMCIKSWSPGMSVSAPLITDPNNHFLGTLPFVHARARNEFLNSIRRAFDDATGEQKSVRVMLHLSTRNGPTLMEMIANVVCDKSELLVILMGRAIDCSLAGLLHHVDNDADGIESQISSGTDLYFPVPSGASLKDHASLIFPLPCGIPPDSTFATYGCPLPLSCGSSLADQEWDENESKSSSITTPSEIESKISSLTTPSMVLKVPPELLQSMPRNAHKCSVCLKNYRHSEEDTPSWRAECSDNPLVPQLNEASTRQLCSKCSMMYFPRIAPLANA